jgi:hypothetical protein
MDRQLISEEDSFLWLSKRDVTAETQSEIVAAEDQALNTNYSATKLLNTETDSKCRRRQKYCSELEIGLHSFPCTFPNVGSHKLLGTIVKLRTKHSVDLAERVA